MAELSVPQIDFSSLGQLPQVYRDSRTRAIREQTLANLGDGHIDYNTAARDLLKAGDFEGGLSLAKLGVTQQQNANGVYGTPIYGTDSNGKTVLGAITKSGQFKPLDTGGVTVNPGVKVIDTPQGQYVVDSRSGIPMGGGQSAPTGGQTTSQGPQVSAPQAAPGFYPKNYLGPEADKKLGAATGEKQAELGKAKASLDSSLGTLDRMAFEADRIAKDPNLGRITGLWGVLPNWPGGGAANVNAKLETLKSQVAFGVLQSMREASKTGGALGAVSDRENQMLTNALAALDRAQSEGEFRAAMKQIVNYTQGAKQRLQQAYDTDYGNVSRPQQPNQPATNPAPTQGRQPVRVRTPEEAGRLPSGTPIILPDGTPGVVP